VTYSVADILALPKPAILEDLSVEAILAERKAKFLELAPSYGLFYDVSGLESDPGVILMEEASYRETLLRARGNDIARAYYLAYAVGAEVDHLGSFYDCLRIPGEADDRYKERIVLAIQGRSTGGTAPRYRSVAMGASLRVRDAVVYTEGTSPQVKIAVYSTENNGVADTALLNAVTAAVTADNVRMVNDSILVRSAVVQVVPVTADIWLLPSTDVSLLTTLQNTIPTTWANESGIGQDLTISWLISKLMVPGVQRVNVTSPAANVVMNPYEAVRISTLTLTLRGRDF
jgi:phage-related baseplate assembly protein